jgi:hypothetical protein
MKRIDNQLDYGRKRGDKICRLVREFVWDGRGRSIALNFLMRNRLFAQKWETNPTWYPPGEDQDLGKSWCSGITWLDEDVVEVANKKIVSSSSGCAKCGKGALLFRAAFPSGCGNPRRLRISIAASFPQPAARTLLI